jgi:hypothetical protein
MADAPLQGRGTSAASLLGRAFRLSLAVFQKAVLDAHASFKFFSRPSMRPSYFARIGCSIGLNKLFGTTPASPHILATGSTCGNYSSTKSSGATLRQSRRLEIAAKACWIAAKNSCAANGAKYNGRIVEASVRFMFATKVVHARSSTPNAATTSVAGR